MGKKENDPSKNTKTTKMPHQKRRLTEVPEVVLGLFYILLSDACFFFPVHFGTYSFVHSERRCEDVIVLPPYNVSL